MNIRVRSSVQQSLAEFLEGQDYLVEQPGENILAVSAIGGPSIYIAHEEYREEYGTLYFELNMGQLGSIRNSAEVLYRLLDLNSEIAPISAAVNSEGEEPALCLVERLETENLDGNEVLAVLEAIGLACLRVQQLLD